MTEHEATVKAVREALASTQQQEIERLQAKADQLRDERAEARERVVDLEREGRDLQHDLDEANAELKDREHDYRLADDAIEQAFQSAMDVERGVYTLGEHIGELNTLRNGAWADRVPVRDNR